MALELLKQLLLLVAAPLAPSKRVRRWKKEMNFCAPELISWNQYYLSKRGLINGILMKAPININLEILNESPQTLIRIQSKRAHAKHTTASLLALNMSANMFCMAEASMARRKQS